MKRRGSCESRGEVASKLLKIFSGMSLTRMVNRGGTRIKKPSVVDGVAAALLQKMNMRLTAATWRAVASIRELIIYAKKQ